MQIYDTADWNVSAEIGSQMCVAEGAVEGHRADDEW